MNGSRLALAAVALTGWLSVGCSQIVGIEDRSGTWCTAEESSHDFCEDFDHSAPFAQWNLDSGSGAKIDASDRSEPNSLVTENGVVLMRHFEASADLELQLDLRLDLVPTGVDSMPTNDHAVALISRSGGSAGLFAGTGGALFFGWMSAIPESMKVSAAGRWVRFGISIEGGEDAKQARLTADGTLLTVAIRPPVPGEPSGKGNDNGPTVPSDVIIGSEPLAGATSQVRCEFDNVTVDVDVTSRP